MKIKQLLITFCDYSLYIKGYSPHTIRGYKNIVNCFCRMSEIEDIEEVNDELVKRLFYKGRIERNWSSSTFIVYHKILKVFFRWCIKNDYLEDNPTDDIEVPRLEKRLPPKLTRQEAMRLLEVAYHYPYKYKFLRYRNHAIFATILFAGLRKQEVLGLKYADVDLENRSIFIRQGKGSKDRVIPMSSRLVEILSIYLTDRQRLNKTCPEFFASLNRDMGLTDTGIRRLVKKIRESSGITFSLHKLRHTFATLMLEGGCDIYSLSKMMGHSDIKTTTIYLAASAEHLRKQIIKHPLNDL